MSDLMYNQITFTHPCEKLTFSFTREKQNNWHRFHTDKLPSEAVNYFDKDTQSNEHFLYTNFSVNSGDIKLEIKLADYLGFTKSYYTHLITQYFSQNTAVVTPNFIKDNEIWICQNSYSSKYTEYKKYVVKVDFEHYAKTPQLTISYEGASKVLKHSMESLIEHDYDQNNVGRCVWNGQLYNRKFLPEKANSEMHNVYPLVNLYLGKIYNIPFKIDKSKVKYLRHYDEINDFYIKFINTEEFKSLIPHSGSWKQINEKDLCQTSEDSNLMVYGYVNGKRHKGHTPKFDINNGAYKIDNSKTKKVIFILHESEKFKVTNEDEIKNASIDSRYLKPEYEKETNASLLFDYLKGHKGFFPIHKKLKQPITFDKKRHIFYSNKSNPLPEILNKIKDLKPNLKSDYLAIYISPISKEVTDESKKLVYYRVKEELLKKRIASQVIEVDTILDENFKLSIQNIGLAIAAKLGSVPWVLDRQEDEELIVGIGAFKPKNFTTRYLGSAFCFSNNGVFKGFDCFPEKDLFALAGSIREAIEKFQENHTKAKRLIIHYYKTMSKSEVNAILYELKSKLDSNIPVVILTINKTESNDLIFFDDNYSSKMPLSGLYVPAGYNTYLLCNNTRYSDAPVGKMDGHPLPIKVKIQSTDENIINDSEEVRKLIDQVYQFSRMYWKSETQQNLPVTIKYPEMLAKMMPYFNDKNLSEFGKNNLWFL